MFIKKMTLGCVSVGIAICFCAGVTAYATGSVTMAFADDDSDTTTATTSSWDGDVSYDWLDSATTTDGVTTYTIASADELAGLASYVNGDYEDDDEDEDVSYSLSGSVVNLAVNVDLSGYTWTPIGTGDMDFSDSGDPVLEDMLPFSGTFNGGGYTISGLTNKKVANYTGLFGYISGATIENVTIQDVTLSGSHGVGAVVGWADDASGDTSSTITGCTVTGTIQIQGYYSVGGILGCGERSSVTNCSVESTAGTDSDGDYVSYVKGVFKKMLESEGDNAGGIAGFIGVTQNTKLISQMYNVTVSGLEVSGTRQVGGILGYTDVEGADGEEFTITTSDSGTTSVTDCYVRIAHHDTEFEAVYSGKFYVGAVLGSTYFDMTISNCSISGVTVGYSDESCVYAGDASNDYANAGYYGLSYTDGTVTLDNCTGSATLVKDDA